MTQLTLAMAGFGRYAKTTRRAAFLAGMERMVPWSALCGLVQPFYPKPGHGRPPVGVERMLRIYFCSTGSTCRTRRWRRRSTTRWRCAVSSGSTWARSRCRTRPRCAASATCSKLIHAVVATPAHVADSTVLPDLLHGKETKVWGDQAYRGQRAVIRRRAPRAKDFVNRRYRHRGVVDETEPAKNRTKSMVRAKVEHTIGVIKRVFGFAKVRYRGLAKNAHRLIVICALANLFIARRHLLRRQEA